MNSPSPHVFAVPPAWLADRLRRVPTKDIGNEVERLINARDLVPGARLPAVRELATELGVSVGTVGSIWAQLKEKGLISTHRRGGTVVRSLRGGEEQEFGSWRDVDLVFGSSDPALLPDLAPHIVRSLVDHRLHSVEREDVTSALRSALAATWPFAAQDWTTAGGGTEGLLLSIAASTPRGQTLLVDEPVTPGLLDTFEVLGVQAVPFVSDDQGPLSRSVIELVEKHRPAAILIQPCAPFASGRVLSAARAADLAAALDGRDVWIVEDDAFGPLASSASASVGNTLPEQVIRVRSYCRAYGVDLRTSVVGGARDLVDLVRRQRSYGTGVNSRILQNTLAGMLTDPHCDDLLDHARTVYRSRHVRLVEALGKNNIHADTGDDGYVVWVEVKDPAQVVSALARHGVIVTTGDGAFLGSRGKNLISIVTTRLPDDQTRIAELAELLAEAIRGTLREFFD
ncbi:MAG: PLP-dependent aminotransferase family protein [Gordonia sp. (in: high G+C Gram-positive bacteria)]